MAKRAADLATVFYQEEFSEEFRWYHDEEDDMKVVLRCIFHFILNIIQDDKDNKLGLSCAKLSISWSWPSFVWLCS